jgi:hypothetical protein
MIHDKSDLDAVIAEATKARDQAQAQFDRIKHSYDSSSIIDAKVRLADAERQLRRLRSEQAGANPTEPRQSGAVFYGSN